MQDKFYHIKQELQKEMNSLNKDIVCFTGYRNQKLPWGFNEKDIRCILTKVDIFFKIEKAISIGKRYFISGMALGFDMMCAEIVLQMKMKYQNIFLECALPCKNQSCKWPMNQQERHKMILKQADKIRCIYKSYVEECMQERNCYMVNKSSLIIALYDGKSGGTKNTLDFAKSQNKEIWTIAPRQTANINEEDKKLLQKYLTEPFIDKEEKDLITTFLQK